MSCVGFSFPTNAICCGLMNNTSSNILVKLLLDQKRSTVIIKKKKKNQKIRKCGDMKATGMNLKFWFSGSAAITL